MEAGSVGGGVSGGAGGTSGASAGASSGAPAPGGGSGGNFHGGSSTPAPQKHVVQAGDDGISIKSPKLEPQGTQVHKEPGQESQAAAEARREAERRKYKLKVDGQELEEELSDDEISVRLQKAVAAEKRMQESAELKKQMRALLEAIKSDPFEALKDPVFGLDLKKMAEDRLIQEYQESQLTAEQKAVLEEQRKREEIERKLKDYEERERQVAQQKLEEQLLAETEREFAEALASEAVPKDRYTMAMMAEEAAAALDSGYELTPKQLAAAVNERISTMTRHALTGLKGEQLARRLGDDVVKEIVRYSVEKVRGKPAPFVQQEPVQTQVAEEGIPSARKKSEDLREFKKWWKMK